MATITKGRPAAPVRNDAARAELAKAHEDLARVRGEAAEAEAAHDAAVSEHRQAQFAVEEIIDHMDDLARQGNLRHPTERGEYQRRVDECRPSLSQARLPLMGLGKVRDAAEARMNEARNRVGFYQSRVQDAALACACAETDPIARVLLTRVQDALTTVLAYGPDLERMAKNGLVTPETRAAIEAAAGNLLNRYTSARGFSGGWTEFNARYWDSPFQGSVAILLQDADGVLPPSPLDAG